MNIPSFELTALGRYVIRFYLSLSLKTGFPNHSGTLNIRHATIVLIASYVACLIVFSKSNNLMVIIAYLGNQGEKIEKKNTLKSHLKLQQLEKGGEERSQYYKISIFEME